MRGSYCLLIKCSKPRRIRIGKLGPIWFKKGFYLYVGSALNGIERRVSRHLGNRKKNYWHIDYFLSSSYVNVERVYCFRSDKKIECGIAERIRRIAPPVKNFGASDCKCESHLFFISTEADRAREKLSLYLFD